ncbi:hypothetical protein DDB_G0283555 [Dictyostelium discoideum AX4]|uniref:Probable spore coat protein DDB_G0283555 n=1 Tax=Dictyostelium discoideum TaxID=44689 RepID=SP51_DICDI|nr:hypothetical protein DDB_G0283555 [Dictyostelium discoideum AX4]Q54QX2.1 RecName: Full=Probable spore coat protein DDB_G0283555; Flags: Precursor [Dictyostelium discoideum]EAL65655.1 hypothetical protein DDB_G0283555 [Dictyostelium discoideum AX4]|eukprot:XP_639012.1 hypothetical protein DDB_G0283555 [Dictyostelium discoideum AX4]
MRINNLLVCLVLVFSTLSISNANPEHDKWWKPPPRNCDSLSEDQCKAPNSGCKYLPFVSCCGTKKFFCVEDNGNGCGNAPLSCMKDSKTDAIYEIWSSCRPNSPFLYDYQVRNETCDQKLCEASGGVCEWVDPVPCMGTSCCPRYPVCKGGGGGGGPVSPCKNVICPEDYCCQDIHGGAYCVEKPRPPPPKPHHLCKAIKCGRGKECIVKDGKACCVPKPKPPPPPPVLCDAVQCPKGFNCVEFGGTANCVECEEKECEHHHCPPGYDCVVDSHHRPHCQRPNPGSLCRNVTCPYGYVCKAINNLPTCIRNPLPPNYPCRDLHCPSGYSCEIINDLPSCVRETHPGHCKTCHDVNCGSLDCAMVPNKCPRGSRDCCIQIPSCRLPSNSNDDYDNDPNGYDDNENEGDGLSIPCGPIITCKLNEICLLEQSRCAPLCEFVKCSPGTKCVADTTGIPVCLPNGITPY